MKSKEILPENERYRYDIREDEELETVAYTKGDIKLLMEALKAAEKEIQDNEQSYLNTLIKRDEEIRKHISRAQDLEKEIKEYKVLAKDNVPELVKMLKNRK